MENRMQRRPGAKTYAGAVTNIHRCKDGRYVHFTANLPHMWRELTRNWMPGTVLAEPRWEDVDYRDARSDEASAVVAEFISGFTADEFVAEAQRRHLSAAPLNTVGEFVDGEQLARAPVASGDRAPGHRPLPCGRASPCACPGPPCGCAVRRRWLDQHREEVLAELEQGREPASVRPEPFDKAQDRPFGKLRTGPSAKLRTGPSTKLRTGPSTKLRTGFAKRSGAKSKGLS